MADAEINQGVQILLNRMDSHPQEFVPSLNGDYPPKWKQLLLKVDKRINDIKFRGLDKNADLHTPPLSFLTDSEIHALHNKIQSIRGDLFTKEVMATLLDDGSSSKELSSSFSGNSLSASKKIKLSGSELAMIRTLGLGIEEYAKLKKDNKI